MGTAVLALTIRITVEVVEEVELFKSFRKPILKTIQQIVWKGLMVDEDCEMARQDKNK